MIKREICSQSSSYEIYSLLNNNNNKRISNLFIKLFEVKHILLLLLLLKSNRNSMKLKKWMKNNY